MAVDRETGLPTGHREDRRVPVTRKRPEAPREWVNQRTGEVQTVDEGLDPAWAGNPGQDRVRVLRERLTQKVESADQQYARAAVRNVVNSPVLDDWMARPEGELPVGVLDRAMQRILGAKSQVVRLSRDTLDKQSRAHGELTAEHDRYCPISSTTARCCARIVSDWRSSRRRAVAGTRLWSRLTAMVTSSTW